MKKRLISALSTIPFIAASALSGDSSAAGCPYGVVNCPYPGQCGRYIDVNGDGLCDLSQTVGATTTDSTSNDQTDASNGEVANNQDSSNNNATDPGNDVDGGFFGDGGDSYYILPVSLLLVVGYLFTYYLFKKGILKRNKHRRIWNLLVTAGYLGTSSTGLLLILLINLGVKTALNPSITFLHVEFSILMVIGTLIHIHIFWRPFKNMLRVLFGFKSQIIKNKNPSKIFMNLLK
jgi:hypothetical protein